MHLGGGIKKISKSKKIAPRNKAALGLLQNILGHRSTISLISGDTVSLWQEIELRIGPEPFCTSCQISSINKEARSKNPLKPKAHFKWVLWILF